MFASTVKVLILSVLRYSVAIAFKELFDFDFIKFG